MGKGNIHFSGCKKGRCNCPNHRMEKSVTLEQRNNARKEAIRKQVEFLKRARPEQDTKA